MSYYPTFAFFAEMPAVATLADAMEAALGKDLARLSVELPDDSGAGPIESDPTRVHQLLADPAAGIVRFGLASSLHDIGFWLTPHGFLDIEFGEFDSELYDEDLTDEMCQDKRRIGLLLHGALLGVGAFLAYTESSDNKSATFEYPLDRAVRIARACAADVSAVQPMLHKMDPWLVAVRGGSALASALDGWLHAELAPVHAAGEVGTVYEHRFERPLFLPRVPRG